MCVRIDGNIASATKREALRVAAKRSNLARTVFAVLFAGWLGQPALAQTLPNPTGLPEAWLKPNPTGLTEADIAPCDELLSIRTGHHPTDLSNLDFALSMPPYAVRQGGPWDLKDTRDGLKQSAQIIDILEKRDEERMRSIIGKVYRGQEYEDRLAGDRRSYCMLNIRLGQLTGVKPSKPTAKPVGPSAAAPAAGAAASGQYVAAQPVAPIAAPLVASTPTSQTNSQRVYLNDGASVIAAFARFGVVLTQVPNSKALQHDKNQFSAYASDCDATRCKAI